MSVRIDQALIESFRAGNFGLRIVYENNTSLGNPEDPFVELVILQGDIIPHTLQDLDQTTGVMNFIVCYPQDTGAIPAKTKVSEILTAYQVGREVTYNGVIVEVTGKQRLSNRNEAGYYQVIGQIRYLARLPR